ncbi:hypothetical protein HPG69_003295 [Diceros bicornis minor]|uniref:Uncharacterized protein n=1 Tax=Diceros bicornis minor TaxID=77932 RepID=A0A7J7E8K6_DICBM|nr:hypothetical protein HPG69_003295 [Diceros bicornis minor]
MGLAVVPREQGIPTYSSGQRAPGLKNQQDREEQSPSEHTDICLVMKPLPQQPPVPANQGQNSSLNTRLQPTLCILPPEPKPAAPTCLGREQTDSFSRQPCQLYSTAPTWYWAKFDAPNQAVGSVSHRGNSSLAALSCPVEIPPPWERAQTDYLMSGQSFGSTPYKVRDSQHMLFPDEKTFTATQRMQNAGLLDGPLKRLQGFIQAMMAQHQSLGKGLGSRHIRSFYEEKKRNQGQMAVPQCSLQDTELYSMDLGNLFKGLILDTR